jgi:hypothetical protein
MYFDLPPDPPLISLVVPSTESGIQLTVVLTTSTRQLPGVGISGHSQPSPDILTSACNWERKNHVPEKDPKNVVRRLSSDQDMPSQGGEGVLEWAACRLCTFSSLLAPCALQCLTPHHDIESGWPICGCPGDNVMAAR